MSSQISQISDNFLSLYKKIISINSSSSDVISEDNSNEEVINLLFDFFSNLGFSCHKIPVKGNHKYNLIAKYGQGNGGIAFSGHTDTVPANLNQWNTNPFVLTETDDKIFGLGVIDMKGFFAFVYEVIQNISLKDLKKPIYIFATSDEETTMQGAIELVSSLKEFNANPDLIVIGEPSSMVPIIMHKGHIVHKIIINGLSAHSSNPEQGINSILIANEIINELLNLKEFLKTSFIEPKLSINYPTLNIGTIKGGDVPNKVCDYCELQFDIRPIPNTTTEQMHKLVIERLKPITDKYKDRVDISIPYAPVEPFGGKMSPELIYAIEESTGKITTAVNYATEATYLQEIGPTVILGPGDIAMAHQPNEYLNKSEILPSLNVLKKLLLKICS